MLKQENKKYSCKNEEIDIVVDNNGEVSIIGWCKVLKKLDPEFCKEDCEKCYCG